MASSPSIRQAISASQHSVTRKAARTHASRRPMMTTSAMTLPLEDQPTIDLQIFDIFDAPSRLGESSKMLAKAAALASSSRAERAMSSTASTSVRHITPLPAPILFDGPASPRHIAHGGLLARRTHTNAPTNMSPREPPSPMPQPLLFDGPSKLRPYVRGGSSSDYSVSI